MSYFCPNCHSMMVKGICRKCGFQEKSSFINERWNLDLELHDWQKEALNRWSLNGNKGIMKVVTGAGKTVLALKAISDITNCGTLKNKTKIFIIVPTVSLRNQWLDALLEKLNVNKQDICLLSGRDSRLVNNHNYPVFLCVINTARELIHRYNYDFKSEGFKTFLIADECHRYGSDKNSNIFSFPYDYSLGLSATPERQSDLGFETKIVPCIGNIIYVYNYADAFRDGIIPPFEIFSYPVCLTVSEIQNYEELSERISKINTELKEDYPEINSAKDDEFYKMLYYIRKNYEDERIDIFKGLTNKRKQLTNNAANRYVAFLKIISEIYKKQSNPKILIFHEPIEGANKLHELLTYQGYQSTLYHSKMKKKERDVNLLKYKNGSIDILISCKALEEGLDVPNTDIGIIVSSTNSPRQFIQRIGRVLRKSPNKEHSQVHVINIPGIDKFDKQEIQSLIDVPVYEIDYSFDLQTLNNNLFTHQKIPVGCLRYSSCVNEPNKIRLIDPDERCIKIDVNPLDIVCHGVNYVPRYGSEYERGYDDGYIDGCDLEYMNGYNGESQDYHEGYVKGYDDGHQEDYEIGSDHGYFDGCNNDYLGSYEGRSKSYDMGYDDGYYEGSEYLEDDKGQLLLDKQ